MTTFALEKYPPVVREFVKTLLTADDPVITENARPLARVAPLTHDLPAVTIPIVDDRFAELKGLPLNERRQIGGAPGFLVYMADDFNAPVEDFGDL